jgi:hypothetical protein
MLVTNTVPYVEVPNYFFLVVSHLNITQHLGTGIKATEGMASIARNTCSAVIHLFISHIILTYFYFISFNKIANVTVINNILR